MASSRLRRAFRYPDDSENDENAREELDEEEQERVINGLKTLHDRRNSEYIIIFTAIPVLTATIYIPTMLSSSFTNFERCLALTCVLSLLTTAHTMRSLPHQSLVVKGKRLVTNSNGLFQAQQLLLIINAACCVLLALLYLISASTKSWFKTEPITSLVPGAMLATVSIARRFMLSVDIKDLENLRYGYKGA
ncbi:uncharacterized protein BO97DRAFT_402944 [Aspergillus homomorphus CBS 101889]|uniref:Uncharacterized protein n=1 Tax=Aspergillus homomorphus (strain CBS 101889) TaxID=1450537 RepID=A0A395IEG1_ASPHC|nr:hypothetical protein BO97DRAFT_402944 [Aspergillus homomorphus CBS 101889]RAL16554.1 hypothetical protein BO97DRAFT_402944 [Aspergillus homomorphus CBS 101889]